jgi:hypothetical protein
MVFCCDNTCTMAKIRIKIQPLTKLENEVRIDTSFWDAGQENKKKEDV